MADIIGKAREWRRRICAFGCAAAALAAVANGRSSVDVTVRHAPHVVSTVTTKTERGSAPCKYCATTIRYDRTFKWDVYNHVWVETTEPAKIPQTCRSCQRKEKEQEELDKEERRLDRELERLQTKDRIREKRAELERLRNARR